MTDDSGGQVSETAAAAGEQEAPGDSVAGHPDDTEAARTDEGSQGPESTPSEERRPDQDDAGR